MKIASHNKTKNPIDSTNTEFRGLLHTSYEDLVTVFGEPLDGDGYKTDVQWKLEIFTNSKKTYIGRIYNYKNGKNFLGDKGFENENIDTWLVSSSGINAIPYIEKYLERRMKSLKPKVA